jgi:hypothetical protein
MNSKVLMVVALLFAGSVAASPEGHENITLGMKPSFGWFTLKGPEETKKSLFDFSSYFKKEVAEVVKPTKFARFKQAVANNPVKTGVAVVATAAVIAAAVVYATSSANDIVTEEESEVYFA